jgi:hypothetical protein
MLQRLHLNAEGWPSEGRSSEGHQRVIRGSSEGHQRAIRGSSEGHQRVIRGSSEGHQRAIRGSSDGTCSLGLAWHESQPRPLMVGFVSPFARFSANSSAACVA